MYFQTHIYLFPNIECILVWIFQFDKSVFADWFPEAIYNL